MSDLGRKSTVLVGSSERAHIKLESPDIKAKHCEFYGIPNKKSREHDVECHVCTVQGKININGAGFRKVEDQRLQDKDYIIIGEESRWCIRIHYAEDNNLKDSQSPFDFEIGSYDEIVGGSSSSPSSAPQASPSGSTGDSNWGGSSGGGSSTSDDW